MPVAEENSAYTIEEIQEAIASLAEQGLIYDTGRKEWHPRAQSYRTVWAVVPPKAERH